MVFKSLLAAIPLLIFLLFIINIFILINLKKNELPIIYYVYYTILDSFSNNGPSEDSKISKIIRKILNEEDTRTLITLCNQLQVFILC